MMSILDFPLLIIIVVAVFSAVVADLLLPRDAVRGVRGEARPLPVPDPSIDDPIVVRPSDECEL